MPLGVALALLVFASSCSRPEPPLVIWIEVDTLRADALGCYGNTATGENGATASPQLDALAKDSVRFERAYSVAPWTIPSLVTQLSGLWPWEHGETRLLEPIGEAHTELVPLLRARGLRTAGVMTNFVATSKQGFERGFERWDDSFAQGHEGSFAEPALQKLLAFGDELRADAPDGLLLFGWLFEPHYRYESHEGLRFGPGFGAAASTPYAGPLNGDEELNALLRERATLTHADRAFLRGNYQSEVAEVDRALGLFVAGLKERGLYDRAWIVFTADHGEEVLDRGWIGHSVTLHDELVRVPLLVKPPRDVDAKLRGKACEDYVSLIDLPATLHALATGKEPDRAKRELGHSRSLVPTIVGGAQPARRWLYLHTDFRPVVQDDLAAAKSADQWGVIDALRHAKWIVDRKGGEARGRLFDLARDPREERDVAGDVAWSKDLAPFQRLRVLVPTPLEGAVPAPTRLPEEPWIPRATTSEGLGPGFDGPAGATPR
ncbi:MAG: sulfatase [Planctomycetes bacterium]|nr:sulfatase [Planctomycetota bacterium]